MGMDGDLKRERERKAGGVPRELVIPMLNGASDTLGLQDRQEELKSWRMASV